MGIPKTAEPPRKGLKVHEKGGKGHVRNRHWGGFPTKKGYGADPRGGRGRTAGHARRHGFTLHYDLTVLGLI